MRFWLDKGVDGYRIDSMNLMSKHPDLPNAPIVDANSEYQSGAMYFASGPHMHEYIKEMRTEVFDKYDCMTLASWASLKTRNQSQNMWPRISMNSICSAQVTSSTWTLGWIANTDAMISLWKITKMWQEAMLRFDSWNAVYMDNHDSGRSLSHYASATAAKMLATHLGTLSGTLFILQGQEIAMANVPREWNFEDYINVEGRNAYKETLQKRSEGADMSDVMRELRLKARDNGRLPMQWDGSPMQDSRGVSNRG
ncbi:hypothetical protein MMC08_006702 [Hypocenomyce scalaris]|nr:hypothetical protein [Hypocenomyce scalaris]